MNEKLQYATMLEIPVSTCTVNVKPPKKKSFWQKKKKPVEEIKEEVINKVNEMVGEEEVLEEQTAIVTQKEGKKAKKLSVIGVELAVICLLIATIFITNAVFPDSGINVFLRSVFGVEKQVEVDDRVHTQFTPVLATDNLSVDLSEGVMTLSGKGSVYSACSGRVLSVENTDTGYVMVIEHNKNFKSVISGLRYAYAGAGEYIYNNIPIGYTDGSVQMCFNDASGGVITDFTLQNGTVVWAV